MAGPTIKIRAQLRKDELTVRALIRHPMEVGRKLKNGKRVAPHFITRVTCTVNEDVVLDADWGGGISKDPYLSFVVTGVAAGARLTLTWTDNQHGHDELSVEV